MHIQSITASERARPVVLIVAHTGTFLTELAPFAQLLRERTGAETIFYCPFVHWTADKFAASCADEGMLCLLSPLRESLARSRLHGSAQSQPSCLGRRVRRIVVGAIRHLAFMLPGIGQSFLAETLAFSSAASEIGDLLAAASPRLLVLGGDMAGYDTALYIKLAHERGVRSLIVPSTMSNGLEQAEVYHGDPSYHVVGWARQLVAALFPKWVITHKGARLFRCPPGRVIAMEFSGLAPPQPWIFNSGFADAIAVESQAMIDYYAKAGMNDRRMVLTGSLSDDAMTTRLASAPQLRERLCGELGFDPSSPLLLAALPPDFFDVRGGRPQCDFKTYDDLVAFWIDTFAGLGGCNCVIALHPSVEVATMRYIERDNVRIGTWKTADMVPVCDVYVASISSTIRWAIACGRPVVNYDVYRYRYTDFLEVEGVLATEEQAEFRSLLHRLIGDPSYRQSVAASQRSVAPNWGMQDGRVGERMLALVERLSGIKGADAAGETGVASQVNRQDDAG